MTSSRRVVAASRPSARTRQTASRPVKIPTSLPPSPVTRTDPARLSRIRSHAAITLAVSFMMRGFCSRMTSESFRMMFPSGLTTDLAILHAFGLCDLIHLKERDTDGSIVEAFYHACVLAFPRRNLACDVRRGRSGKCLVVLCAVGIERIAAHVGEQRAGRSNAGKMRRSAPRRRMATSRGYSSNRSRCWGCRHPSPSVSMAPASLPKPSCGSRMRTSRWSAICFRVSMANRSRIVRGRRRSGYSATSGAARPSPRRRSALERRWTIGRPTGRVKGRCNANFTRRAGAARYP